MQTTRQEEKSGDDDDPKGNPPSSSEEDADGLPKDESRSQEPRTHQGKLILDATCAPADIAYQTDLALLNTTREKLEDIIDTLHVHTSAT